MSKLLFASILFLATTTSFAADDFFCPPAVNCDVEKNICVPINGDTTWKFEGSGSAHKHLHSGLYSFYLTVANGKDAKCSITFSPSYCSYKDSSQDAIIIMVKNTGLKQPIYPDMQTSSAWQGPVKTTGKDYYICHGSADQCPLSLSWLNLKK